MASNIVSSTNDGAPRCYFAVYADPALPGHVSVEGGRFGNRGMPANMRPGDMVLLYCTGTFALGINMPARAAAFDAMIRFDGRKMIPLPTREFMQMAGRAGRRAIAL